jgi:integrase/recombinase XerC
MESAFTPAATSDLALVDRQCVEVRRASAPATIAGLREKYLAWLRARRSPATAVHYSVALERFCQFTRELGIFTPAEVDHRTVDQFLTWLREQGNSVETTNHRLAAVRSFYKFLRREGVLSANPAADCDRLRQRQKSPPYLTIDECKRLLARLSEGEGIKARRNEAVIALATLSGLRVSEMASLRVEDLSMREGVMRVVNGKGGKDREVPIVPRLKTILSAYLKHTRPELLAGVKSPWVFVSLHPGSGRNKFSPRPAGSKLCRHSINFMLRGACTSILGRHVHPHLLRHSFASWCRRRGLDLMTLAELLGHSSVSTTQTYAHVTSDDRSKLLRRVLR